MPLRRWPVHHHTTVILVKGINSSRGLKLPKTSWAAGLEIARIQAPDLILLDLPADGGGIEKLRELRAEPRTAAIPVVFLSGEDLSGARELTLAIGGCAWVPRPVDVRVLLAAIDQFVQ